MRFCVSGIAEPRLGAYAMDPSDFLTPTEAAEYLRLSPITLAQWRSKDRGPAFVKFGSAVRYLRADLDDWAAAQRVNTDAA